MADPNWSSVVTYLRFNNVGSATVIDEVGGGRTWTLNGGAAQSATGAIKGGGSLRMVGNTGPMYVNGSDHLADWHFGTGDFTLDVTVQCGEQGPDFFTTLAQADGAWFFRLRWFGRQVEFMGREFDPGAGFLTDGLPHAIRLSRVAGVLYCQIDGRTDMLSPASYAYTDDLPLPTGKLIARGTAGDQWYAGVLDEFRVTKGVGRSTGPYTLQPGEFELGGGTTYELLSTPASYAVTSASARLSLAAGLRTTPASYALTPVAARLARALTLASIAASYAITPVNGRLSLAANLRGTPASYALTPAAARLSLAAGLASAPASYAITPAQAQLSYATSLSSTPASYSLTFADATLQLVGSSQVFTLESTPGVFTLAAVAARLQLSTSLRSTPAAIAITPVQARLQAAFNLRGEPGSVALTPVAAAMARVLGLASTPASYALTPGSAVLQIQRGLVSIPAVFLLETAAARMSVALTWTSTPGAYSTTFYAATMEVGSAFEFGYSERVMALFAEDRTIALVPENRLIPPV